MTLSSKINDELKSAKVGLEACFYILPALHKVPSTIQLIKNGGSELNKYINEKEERYIGVFLPGISAILFLYGYAIYSSPELLAFPISTNIVSYLYEKFKK